MSTYPQYASQWPVEYEARDRELSFETEINVEKAREFGVDLAPYAEGALDLPVEACVTWNFADGITEIDFVTDGIHGHALSGVVIGNRKLREYLCEKWADLARAVAGE